jgi:hypothetical protein
MLFMKDGTINTKRPQPSSKSEDAGPKLYANRMSEVVAHLQCISARVAPVNFGPICDQGCLTNGRPCSRGVEKIKLSGLCFRLSAPP